MQQSPGFHRCPKMIFHGMLAAIVSLFYACTATQKNYSSEKKYGRAELKEDYTLLRNILEKKHPSLYWYTSKDSMDYYFEQYERAITDSMTELEFGWKILAPLTKNIHCGHTSFNVSKGYNRWVSGRRMASFPLFMKIWGDTMVVTSNLNRKDSILRRGVVITSINGESPRAMINRLSGYMSTDGYAYNVNLIRLSGNFPYFHRQVYGLRRNYTVGYKDSTGIEKKITIPLYDPSKDTLLKRVAQPVTKIKTSRRERRQQALQALRSLSIDTAQRTAILTLNAFSGGRLRSFFRRSFRTLSRMGIPNLVLDIRSNGGGRIGISTLLTRYISRQPFKIADSATLAVGSLRPYTRYIKNGFFTSVAMTLFSRKRSDGRRHFGFWERRLYHPKRQRHFDGEVYVLTNGASFSASALFCNAIKGQPGITLVGEDTGGGWHGNSGVLIPDITLPHTRLRVRLPLVRLVQYKHVPKLGQAIPPDVFVGPSYDALMKGYDKKMEVVRQMIRARAAATLNP